MTTYTEKTVGELVAEKPGRARVLEKYGIDYCCGGKQSLAEACSKKGVDAEEVLRALNLTDVAPSAGAGEDTDWRAASMSELVDNIVQTHHAYLVRELPRLLQMSRKVAEVHGERHPEMREVAEVFDALQEELFSHMMKEEHILFPWIKSVDSGEAGPMHCGTVQGPISVMEHEHDNAGRALERMRELTGGYVAPEDACNTFRVLLAALQELEADLHVHIHKENNILFPKAKEAEWEMWSQASSV